MIFTPHPTFVVPSVRLGSPPVRPRDRPAAPTLARTHFDPAAQTMLLCVTVTQSHVRDHEC